MHMHIRTELIVVLVGTQQEDRSRGDAKNADWKSQPPAPLSFDDESAGNLLDNYPLDVSLML